MKKTPRNAQRRARSARGLLALLVFVMGLGTIPHRVCERDALAYFEGDAEQVDALAGSVATWTERTLDSSSFATGSPRFDGEWLFGTYMMAAMGFGQVALARDDAPAAPRRIETVARMERCLDAMLSPAARVFDRDAWALDALASTEEPPGSPRDHGHVAYLGYAGLALGVHRLLVPHSRFDARHDAIVAALARRFEASRTGLVETYPNEVYPVDNTAALGALALHAKATGTTASPGLARGLEAIRTHGIQRESGLLAQAVDVATSAPRDPGRGSGTALAAYFIAYADPATSASLYRAVRRELYRTVIGFGAILEHPASCDTCSGRVDIDSGPLAFGFGVSATGFAIGASRANDDRDAFASLYATAHLFGAPFDEGSTRTFATGGPLGDAILFAMLTAPRSATLARAS
ncbi:MAG: hypothetical protein JWP87_5340 [Labilithrix sp.]|nr:hypothetical protein [Labilithrix sp.]